jgi:hypothetical protein
MRFNYEVIYQVNLYRTDDGAGAWYSSQFETTNILGIANPGIPDTYYDFAFKASKSGITFRDNNSSNTPYTSKPDTLACNTKSVKINYVWFNDTLGVNKYEWTWGDRKSSEQFPEIIFDKAGSYNVKLKITKQDNSGETFEQLIVIQECNLREKFVDSVLNSNNINVFPNPTSEILKFLLKESSNYQFEIFDSSGRLIRKGSFMGNSNEVNCKGMSIGLYFIKVFNPTCHYFSKFIKE